MSLKRNRAQFEKLKELVILEEFKNKVQTDIKAYLDEQKVNELEKAAVLADDFALTHKHKFSPHFQNRSPKTNRKYFSQNSNWQLGNKVSSTGLKGNSNFRSDNPRQKSDEQKGNQKISSIKCAQCGRKGHISSDCFQIVGYPDWHSLGKRTDKPSKGNPVGLIGLKSGLSVDQLGCNEKYQPFISKGLVSLNGKNSKEITILRDTGATQSILLENVLPISKDSDTGAKVLISGVELGTVEIPLHKIELDSDLVKGEVIVGVRHSLPVPGISLILGNDLAGEKVTKEPHVIDKPTTHKKTEQLVEEFPEIFPSCVVT